MNFDPLLNASFAIQLHAYAAIAAFGLGALILFRRKGGHRHRLAGRVWVALMLVVCISSFFIHTIRLWGLWSPIHLLSIGTLVALVRAVQHARVRNIVGHRVAMQSTYLGALIIAGFFTFLPGRIMYEVFFEGSSPSTGIAVVTAIVAGGAWGAWRGMRPNTPRSLPRPQV